MKQLPSYGDARILAFCGGETGTRDHCPSRVFLDEPYPENLAVVPACSACNSGFSADEEYFACLISCIIAGSATSETLPREKKRRILTDKPLLRARIEQARSTSDGVITYKPKHERMVVVITKLAQGHALYELHEACLHTPKKIDIVPLALMTREQREAFEHPEASSIWPEGGSRAMHRLVEGTDLTNDGWIVVQPERYGYNTSISSGIDVRIVIQEYLAGHILWE